MERDNKQETGTGMKQPAQISRFICIYISRVQCQFKQEQIKRKSVETMVVVSFFSSCQN